VVQAGRRLLASEALTPKALGERLRSRWPERDPTALAYAVRSLVPLVQPPPRGLWGQQAAATHILAETWLGRRVSKDARPDAMILRYLQAFGPASVRDVQAWAGLTRLQPVIERLRPRLRCFCDDQGVELLDVADGPLPDPTTAAPVRFVPAFDNILLAHADRTRIIADAHRARVFTKNGLVQPTVLVDGFVAGMWRIDQDRSGATLAIELFAPASKRAKIDLEREGAALLAFAAPGGRHRIRFGPLGASDDVATD
jgi:hypothetical protein